MTREVVDYYVERLMRGQGFKYPVGIVYDHGESRFVHHEGYNRSYAAIGKGYDYILGKLEEKGWLEVRDTFGLPDVRIIPLGETFNEYPADLPPTDSEFFEQNGKK